MQYQCQKSSPTVAASGPQLAAVGRLHGLDSALAGAGQLRLAERVVECPEAQAERQAAPPGAEALTPVDIEEPRRLE